MVIMSPIEDEILFPNSHSCPTLLELKKMCPSYITSMDSYKFVAHYIKFFTGTRRKHQYYIGDQLSHLKQQLCICDEKKLKPDDQCLYLLLIPGDKTDKYVDLMNYRDHYVARTVLFTHLARTVLFTHLHVQRPDSVSHIQAVSYS